MSLRRVRELIGLSQTQAAHSAGLSQTRVCRIEGADLDTLKVGTLRRYLDGLAARLVLEAVLSDGSRVPIDGQVEHRGGK
ncbi:helix-turn-helix domain-containing protein [Bifidobacterium pseudolongum]|uniref:helix-turn-helix domain-containing protein n=1 Tax=Bifidobacterium pseudolongum TaxID=1694 RepID=UPI00209DE32A|nr:helix-turn-helix domain-containing protein [Bifidobacterium pseudolongum]